MKYTKQVLLNDISDKITDYVASGSFASLKANVNIYKQPNYALLVKTADFNNDFSKDLTYTDKHGYEFLHNSNLFGGELILSNIGSIGKVFIVPKLNMPMTLASNSIMVKPDENHLIKYLYYFFLSPKGQQALKNISSQTSVPKFNKTELKTVLVPEYKIDEQEYLVKLFDSIIDIIEKQKTKINRLDELVKARFVEMFGNPLENVNNYDKYNWEELTDFITYGLTVRPKYVDNGVSLISARELKNGIINYDDAPRISIDDFNKLSDKSKPDNKEVFMSKTGTIGISAIYSGETKIAITQNIARIHLKENVNHTWFKFYLDNVDMNYHLNKLAKGNTVKDLQIQDMKRIICYLPPLDQQNRFETFVKQIDKSKFVIQKQIEETQKLYDSLMQEYFG